MKATEKLIELCEKFEKEVIDRARLARERANLPKEATQIPDYRQLLLTKKFAKFQRCTCDHPKQQQQAGVGSEAKLSSHCRKHNNRISSSPSSSSTSSSSRSSSSSAPSEDDDDDESTTGEDDDDSSEKSSNCPRRKSEKKTRDTPNASIPATLNLEQGEIPDVGDDKNEEPETKQQANGKPNHKEEKFDDIRSMELHRKQNHPERLHPDLSFNEPDQVSRYHY